MAFAGAFIVLIALCYLFVLFATMFKTGFFGEKIDQSHRRMF
jgi:hypothetical protein